jgi:colicin import membrane protein
VRRTEETRRAAEAQKVAEARKVQEQRRIAAAGKPAETKASETAQVTTTPSRKRTAAQRQAERKERIARKSGGSRKVAGMAIRKRARQTASAGTGKGGRRKAVHDTCRVAGNRTSVPGWYIVRRGDTLWKIAARHYGKGRRFPVIYRANTRRIADPDLIFRCQRIYLPKFRRRT